MEKEYDLVLYKIKYGRNYNKEIVIYAPTEIEYYFLSNNIRFVRCMLYKHIKLDMKQVNRHLKELAKQYENSVSI
jgi:hypothetical protein